MRTLKAGARGKTPVCKTCGGRVLFGNLFCSEACGQKPKEAKSQLVEAGFEPDPYTPNIYRKDGVAVTVEQVNHVGIEKAVQHHRQAQEAEASRSRVSRPV